MFHQPERAKRGGTGIGGPRRNELRPLVYDKMVNSKRRARGRVGYWHSAWEIKQST